MKSLLIAWHSRTGAAEQMARALARGAAQTARELEQAADLRVELRPARSVQAADLLACDGYLFCAPENLGGLSGEMKELFDRCYYGVLERIEGRPYALAVSAGTDGAGAVRQAERICTGWRLRAVAPALIERSGAQTPAEILAPKTVSADALARCEELGGLLAATLLAGVE
ncbi:flavodoxin family protein [Bordetella genomosp. 2]|uniref:Flavodoxin n=1 Tax=Bordetella genomosp. 2 TaxID=1983456 RepID=A0A261W1K8_9BORD|nr:NAD(P)H-dependent oxidoreductase [Bordetella genomosp. 2]OZI79463.1 flavodoxin [Bordetella genomosp. 2]